MAGDGGGSSVALLHVPERAQGPLALGVDAARGGSGPPERDLEPAAVGAEALGERDPVHRRQLIGKASRRNRDGLSCAREYEN